MTAMTTIHTTPSVWVAMQSSGASQALVERINTFAESHEVQDIEVEASRILHDVGQHASAWLVVDGAAEGLEALSDLAWKCTQANDCFRCLIIGSQQPESWPEGTIFLPPHALSTTILDRLRLESHALRIRSRRNRTIQQMRQRP